MPTPIAHGFLIVSAWGETAYAKCKLTRDPLLFPSAGGYINGKFTILSFNFNIKNRGEDYFKHIYLTEISMNIVKQRKLITVAEIHNCCAFSFVLSFSLTC